MALTQWERNALNISARDFPSEAAKHDHIRDHFHGSVQQYEIVMKELVNRPDAQEYLASLEADKTGRGR